MARRGEAKDRFKSQSDGSKTRCSWRVIADPGQLLLVFYDPRDGAPPQQLNLTTWLPLGKTAALFAEAFARSYLPSKSRTTRFNSAKSFHDGFVRYLCESGIKLDTPEDAEPRLLEGFRRWLRTYQGVKSRKHDSEGEKTAHSRMGVIQTNNWTQANLWKPCKAIFSDLLRHSPEGTWRVEIPKKPFAGEKFLPPKKQEIDLNEYTAFLAEAAREASELIDFVEPHFEPISRAIRRIEKGGTYRTNNINDVVAKALLDHDGIIPERKLLLKKHPELFGQIEMHGYSRICRLAHPQFGDLVPFLYLMASHTAFNQQPLTHLGLSQIQEPMIFGVTRMTLSPQKLRAGSVVRRSFVLSEDKLAVPSIINFLIKWTSHLRKMAPEFCRDDLWLFANKWKSGENGNFPVRSLSCREKNNQNELGNHLLRYCKKRGHKFTGLKEIRLSFSELFLRANPGDVEGLRILLGQKRVATTTNHYRTQQAVAEGQEMLAGAMNMHQRWVDSDGKIDTRSVGEKRERTAATPGFICADPFDSPIPGQKKGRMCEAYGQCPGCPLVASDSDLPYALARFHQLAHEYEAAKMRLGIEIWKRKYFDSSNALSNHWIPSLSAPAIVEAARQLHLPRLPYLE